MIMLPASISSFPLNIILIQSKKKKPVIHPQRIFYVMVKPLIQPRPIQVPTDTNEVERRRTDPTASQAHCRCLAQWSAAI